MNKEDCEQRLNKIRETNRKAQKKYYDNPENRQKKVEKQKERRALKREQCRQFNEAQAQPVCTQQPEPEPVCTQQSKTKTIPNTLEEIIGSLEGKFTSKKSEETYRSGVKRLFHLGECSNIIVCLKKPKSIIDKIQNGMNKDKPYSVSAKKGVFQTILWLLDNILTAESGAFTQPMWAKLKKMYKEQFDLTKTKSYVEHETTQQTEVVPTFEEYLNRLREKYPDSTTKQSILPRLYSLFTVRDDFKSMKIISSLNNDDYINNFVYIPRSGFIKIIINKYKTKSGDSRLIFSLNNKVPEQKQLSIDIKTYVKNNNLSEGDFIFGKTSLSLFISKINESIGFNGGINLFRHMRASEGATNSDYTERHLLSKQMGHSIATSAKYVRKINK
jgi:hypothetical protein